MDELKALLKELGITSIPDSYFSEDAEKRKTLKPKEDAATIKAALEEGISNRLKGELKTQIEKEVKDEIFAGTMRKAKKSANKALNLGLTNTEIDKAKEEDFWKLAQDKISERTNDKDVAELQNKLAALGQTNKELTEKVTGFDGLLKGEVTKAKENAAILFDLQKKVHFREDLKIAPDLASDVVASKVMGFGSIVRGAEGKLELRQKENQELKINKEGSDTEFWTLDDKIEQVLKEGKLIKESEFEDPEEKRKETITESPNNNYASRKEVH